MNEAIIAAKVVSLFLAIAYGSAWFVQAARGQPIPAMQTFAMAGGIVGFITLQWLL